MKIKPTDSNIAPSANVRISDPMAISRPENSILDGSGDIIASGVNRAAELVGTVICLPDLSGENPFA